MVRRVTLTSLLLATLALNAQTPATAPLQSHQINPDNSITFRILSPGSKSDSLSIDAFPKPLPMTEDAAGVWTATTPVLTPEYYGYTFNVDGHAILDPLNGQVRPSLTSGSSVVLVPAPTPAPWELAAIPHGRVDHHTYTTHIAKNLPRDQESYVVYTPPAYDPAKKDGYPVLYLLHGWSDDENGWTAVGHANDILDSLIAANKAVPMIVVMPLGYGDFGFVTNGFGVWSDEARVNSNVGLYEKMIETEIMPAVDHEYNVAKGRDNHAIAGLSMGGLEGVYIGLTHPDQFAYVGGMSSAIHGEKFDEHLPQYSTAEAAKKANLKLLWIACATSDRLLMPNRHFITWARAKGFDVTSVETSGSHTWLVWRDNLIHLAPLLFKTK